MRNMLLEIVDLDESAQVLVHQWISVDIALKGGICSKNTSTKYGCRSMIGRVNVSCQDVNIREIQDMIEKKKDQPDK